MNMNKAYRNRRKYIRNILIFVLVIIILGSMGFILKTMIKEISIYNKEVIVLRDNVFLKRILCALGIFLTALFCFLGMMCVQIKNNNKAYKRLKKQNKDNLELLQKMKCMIFEYDVETGRFITNDYFEKEFGEKLPEDILQQIDKYKAFHPEFEFDRLRREMKNTIRYKETRSLESVYCPDKSTYRIISIVMMPVTSENGDVIRVLGSVRKTNDEHQQIQEKLDMFNQIPGGTYRCHLGDFNYLEYVGERLCNMLGYTVEEFQKITENYYINIVVEEDREKYNDFISQAAVSCGVKGCRYNVYCKNGETLYVLDTMESTRSDNGNMRGYSVVIDISEYTKAQNIVRQELQQLEANLEMMRVKNSTSQMQPHFLYNALASIRELILIDPEYASDMICDFTNYLRACIRTMQNEELVPIDQEIHNIQAYTNIEKMRMGKRLKVNYELKSEDFDIVPLSVQPLVENAIRHGIYHRGREGGTVTIRTETIRDYNLIVIKDNGVGFDYQKVRNEVERGERDSIGLDNAIFRLKKQLQADVIINSKIGIGTRVVIRVPRKGKNEGSYS